MICTVITDTRKITLAEGQKLAYSVRISGDPMKEDTEIVLDFIRDPEKGMLARLSRTTTSDKRCLNPKTWGVDAIRNRDAKGLEGFIEFANTLGIEGKYPGATLANIIEEKAKKI